MIRKFHRSEVVLEYKLTGEKNKASMMFVHGAGSNLRQFNAQHEYFSDQFKVLSISLRGHGNSSNAQTNRPTEYTLQKNSEDIVGLLEHLGIDNVHYVGNSVGGLIGYELYKMKPELFTSLVTFGTTAEMKLPPFTVNVISLIDQIMFTYNRKSYARFLGKYASEISEVQKEVRSLLSTVGKGIQIRKNVGNYSYVPLVENMTIPYLLIQGVEDENINENLQTTTKAIMSNENTSIVKLEKAGHFLNLEQPQIFNQIMESFIKHYSE